jgi:hypothetical protein
LVSQLASKSVRQTVGQSVSQPICLVARLLGFMIHMAVITGT